MGQAEESMQHLLLLFESVLSVTRPPTVEQRGVQGTAGDRSCSALPFLCALHGWTIGSGTRLAHKESHSNNDTSESSQFRVWTLQRENSKGV